MPIVHEGSLRRRAMKRIEVNFLDNDVVEIEGIKFSQDVFRKFSKTLPLDHLFAIQSRKDGVVCIVEPEPGDVFILCGNRWRVPLTTGLEMVDKTSYLAAARPDYIGAQAASPDKTLIQRMIDFVRGKR